jgi:undecaprenyl-diphosphatase
MVDMITAWELSILHRLTDGGGRFWDIFWTAITYLGEAGVFWIALSLFLLLRKKTRKVGIAMSIALLLGLILGNGVMKNLFARPRPYQADPTLFPRLAWGQMTGDYSFPSGHTMASFEGATVIFSYHKKWGLAALTLAFLISLSRLFLAVHYPTDLLAGAAFGALFALVSLWTVKKIKFFS